MHVLIPHFLIIALTGMSLDPLFSPLIVHTSQPSETHYYPIGSPDRRILLHTHISAPYVPRLSASESKALDFIIYSSGSTGCADLVGFTIELDWFATLGRWGSRYLTTLVSWAVGVVAFVLFEAWGLSDKFHGRYSALFSLPIRSQILAMPTVHQSLSTYSSKPLRKLMLASFLISFLPLPVEYYLGNEGDILFAPIAPLLLFIASGLVFVSWWVLVVLMWPLGKVGILLVGRSVIVPIVVELFLKDVEDIEDMRNAAFDGALLFRSFLFSC